MNQTSSQQPNSLRDFLILAIDSEASDLHLVSDQKPVIRRHGLIQQVSSNALGPNDVNALAKELLSAPQLETLSEKKQVDASYEMEYRNATHRCRVNLFTTSGELGICIRLLPSMIPDCDWLGFPQTLANRISQFRDGLVVCTGPTGSGKSTTMAMLVNMIHESGGKRIITIEEPIEYRYPAIPNSLATQREIGTDVSSFADGLRSGLRQDPDVILVGEIRDLESARIALSAAETGHLVFTSLHTRDAKGAISRLVDLFPPETQRDARHQLSWALRAIIAQRLVPSTNPTQKRALATEVLLNLDPIPAAIRSLKLDSIDNYLVTKSGQGMQSFDESIIQLFKAGCISKAVAKNQLRDSIQLRRLDG